MIFRNRQIYRSSATSVKGLNTNDIETKVPQKTLSCLLTHVRKWPIWTPTPTSSIATEVSENVSCFL